MLQFNYAHIKRFLFLILVLTSSNIGFGQLVVQSGLVDGTNQFSAHLCDGCPDDEIAQDRFFSISPGGIPQNGRDVSWNLEPLTEGTARFYHVKKGHWDLSAIRSAQEDVLFNISEVTYPSSATPSVDMGTNWIKIGKSWNFSRNSYTVAIIPFKNQSNDIIEIGNIIFSHDNLPFLQVDEIMIYNEWVSQGTTNTSPDLVAYNFTYRDLAPNEIRYLYIKMSVSKGRTFSIPRTALNVEMTGFQNASLDIGGSFPPHDPNSIILLNAFDNTPPILDCSPFNSYDDIMEQCSLGLPFWYNCKKNCPEQYSLNYPYCNVDSEVLNFQITCLNDGLGVARDVFMGCKFYEYDSPFTEEVFDYSSSYDVRGEIEYPYTNFFLDEINLPGLGNKETVYTYDECSALVNFSLKTRCNLETNISAYSSISFYDTNGNAVDPVTTADLVLVPEQGIYTNYTPECISCSSARNGHAEQGIVKLRKNQNTLSISFERESKENSGQIRIFDLNGRLFHERNISPNGYLIIEEQFDVSLFNSGVYFVSIQSGDFIHTEKFVHY